VGVAQSLPIAPPFNGHFTITVSVQKPLSMVVYIRNETKIGQNSLMFKQNEANFKIDRFQDLRSLTFTARKNSGF